MKTKIIILVLLVISTSAFAGGGNSKERSRDNGMTGQEIKERYFKQRFRNSIDLDSNIPRSGTHKCGIVNFGNNITKNGEFNGFNNNQFRKQ